MLLCSIFILTLGVEAHAQITILTPNLGFTQACADSDFNSYSVSFSFYPSSSLGPGNQFIVELSDANGSFTSPTTLQSLSNTTSPVSGNFGFPTNTGGENYKIRVRSTNPVAYSPATSVFSAYYAVHNQPFSINNYVSTVNVCSFNTFTLSVDDTGSPASPTYYPNLNYIWYKDFVEIPGETGPTIDVTSSGSYYVIVDYGSCVMDSYSNIVDVEVIPDISPTIDVDDGSTTICPSQTKTLTSVLQDPDYIYTWYKDNIAIPTSNAPSLQTTAEGLYHLEINHNGCYFDSNAIQLNSNDFQLDLNTVGPQVIIPGETINISAISDATSPTYQWYRNNVAIPGANQANLAVTEDGTYKVIVTQNTPCFIEKESTINFIYPSSFNLLVNNTVGYSQCVSTSTTLEISLFEAISAIETINLIGNSLGFSYQWYKDGIAITGATSTTLVIDNATGNGDYTLEVDIPVLGTVTSDVLSVNLALAPVVISNVNALCEGSSTVITSNTTAPEYSYQWYFNGNPISGATTASYTANQEGNYYLSITSGSCNKQSNIINLALGNITATATVPVNAIIVPGQTKPLTITTDAINPEFEWYKDNIIIGGATSATYNALEPGTYKIVVTEDEDCVLQTEIEFVLNYPTGFTILIAPDTSYQSCSSTLVTMNITQFRATTPTGYIDILNNNYNYNYQWYRDGTAISGATNNTITVNNTQPNGNYTLEVTIPDFGQNNSNSLAINLAIQPISITNDGPLCDGSSTELSANIADPTYQYQWHKNGTAISGATNANFTTNEEGTYSLWVTSGTCNMQSNTISLTLGQINVTPTSPTTDVIIPGELKSLTVNTDAINPEFEWYKDNVIISGATTNSYNATEAGNYKVIVIQDEACIITHEELFTLNYPLSFNVQVAPDAFYQSCTSTSTSLDLSLFNAATSNGSIDLLNNPYDYTYQWYKNGTAIAGAINTSLNIDNTLVNGSYYLEITLPGYGIVSSNTITIDLAVETLTISNSGVLCEGGSTSISSNITDPSYTYQWYKNGIPVSGAIAPSYNASQEGNFTLNITSGNCNLESNTLTLTYGEIAVTGNTSDNDIILPGETKTLSVTTDATSPSYQWYKDDVSLPGETSSLYNATQAGVYKVVVSQTDGCTIENEKIFTLDYPNSYTISIEVAPGYDACTSNDITLQLSSFTATTSQGTVDLMNNSDINHTFQWIYNGSPIPNSDMSTITIDDSSLNGDYQLSIDIPGNVTTTSNTISVELTANEPLIITSSGLLCSENPQVDINSNISGIGFIYNWFKDGILLNTTTINSITVTQEGSYTLTVDTGTCVLDSNTLIIEESTIEITPTGAENGTIIPGEIQTISVTTDAIQPNYQWYRNDIILSGENTPTLQFNQDGDYKVVVTQTLGCIMEEEMVFNMDYPSEMILNIAPSNNYNECESTETILGIESFVAVTSEGNIDLIANPYNYSYQWFKGSIALTGETNENLSVEDYSANDTYHLEVLVPDFATVTSNILDIKLKFIDQVNISTGDVLCAEGSEVEITSNVSNPEFTYKWFNSNSVTILGNSPSIIITQEGDYYLEVSYDGCTVTSNTLQIVPFDTESISINQSEETTLIEGTTITAVASGANIYTWYFNGTIVSNTDEVLITQEGTYTLVAIVGNCEITKEIHVTEVENLAVAIPNVVTLNGDGINDYWGLPNQYVNKENVEVIIYGSDGMVVYRARNYMNNWPESDFEFSQKNPVYYYNILEDNIITQKGSITMLK